MNIQNIHLDDGRNLRVVRDDLIEGGTKIRGIIPYFKNILKKYPHITEFVYASPAYGYAQVAITVAANILNRNATIFVAKRKDKHPNTALAEELGAKIVEVPYGYLVVVKKHASDYVDADPDRRFLLPWGLSDPIFKSYLAQSLHKNIPKVAPGSNVWIVVGSGTLFETLAEVFPPYVKFNLVQVGAEYEIPPELEDRVDEIYVTPEKFEQKAKILPPYPSNLWYDAKLWRFVLEHAKNGDIVWNVA